MRTLFRCRCAALGVRRGVCRPSGTTGSARCGRRGRRRTVIDPERMPVVGPRRRDDLELDEPLTVPLVDHGVTIRSGDVCKRYSLGHAEEVTFADLPMPPLLGSVRLDGLERDKGPVDRLMDRGFEGVLVGSGTPTDAGGREERPVVDPEELGVLATGRPNRRVLDVFAVTTHQNEHVGVAVPGVHPGLSAGNVNGELWDGDQIDAIDTERLHGSCARCPNSLHFGNGDDHCWPQNSTRDPGTSTCS